MINFPALIEVLWIFKWWILGIAAFFTVAHWVEGWLTAETPNAPGPARKPLPTAKPRLEVVRSRRATEPRRLRDAA